MRKLRDVVRRSVGINVRYEPQPTQRVSPAGGLQTPDLVGLQTFVKRALRPIARELDDLKIVMRAREREGVDPLAFVRRSQPRLSDFGRPSPPRKRKRYTAMTYRTHQIRGSSNNVGEPSRGLTARSAARRSMGLPDNRVQIVGRASVRDAIAQEAVNHTAQLESAEVIRPLATGAQVYDKKLGVWFANEQARRHYYSGVSNLHSGNVTVLATDIDAFGRKR